MVRQGLDDEDSCGSEQFENEEVDEYENQRRSIYEIKNEESKKFYKQ